MLSSFCTFIFSDKCINNFIFRYGWDDPYEYDEYEGWFQDPETGQWKLDPAVREYYEKLGITIPDPDTDNETSASNREGRVDNSRGKEVQGYNSKGRRKVNQPTIV